MKNNNRSASATVAGVLLLVGYVDAFWRMSCGIIQVGRVDPLLSFGEVSNHVHKISGASNIGISSTYDTLIQSNCTSCTIQADKSAYWTPALYYFHADGTYEEVQNSGTVVYYLGRGSDPFGNMTATPFPPGFRMLTGNSIARTQDMTTMTWGNSSYPSRLASEAISMVCIDYDNAGEVNTGSETVNITNMNCPDGFRAQVQMATCWDGVNLYLSNQAHVAHLSQIDNGICPPTHPVLFPHLFYELYYSVEQFYGGDGQFVFANGDMTGYGFHGDFINGWDIPTLTEAIDECLIDNESGVVDECSAFSASNDPDSSSDCPERSPIFPCEPVKGIIAKLPGCITPTGYGVVVTSADITCPGGNSAACNATIAEPPLPWAGDSRYAPLGCYTEGSSSRALSQSSYTSSTNMTATTCEAFCDGYQYFAVEYSQECYCGDIIRAGSVKTNASDCSMPCSGDQWQICGGGSRLNMYQLNSTLAAPSPSSSLFSSIGCYTEASNGRALSDKSYTDTTNMTVESCQAFCGTAYTYVGLEYSQECYCGNVLNTGSVPALASDCSSACTGDKFEFCGAGNRLNVYQRNPVSSSVSSSATTSSLGTSRTSSSFSTSSVGSTLSTLTKSASSLSKSSSSTPSSSLVSSSSKSSSTSSTTKSATLTTTSSTSKISSSTTSKSTTSSISTSSKITTSSSQSSSTVSTTKSATPTTTSSISKISSSTTSKSTTSYISTSSKITTSSSKSTTSSKSSSSSSSSTRTTTTS